jgi:phospholipid/cholesterol/gamma-HCH transport system substrate-binding protein
VKQAIRKHAADFAAIVAMVAVALGVAGYILVNQAARPTFPFIEDPPILIEAELSDAQAVVPGQGQSVRVAGVQVGQIGAVRVEDGLAIVEMDIEAKYADLIREDASALLRPRTGLKDMFMEVDPGTQATPAMGDGGRITVANTAPDIDPDEILSALDTDTRAYLKLLIGGAGKGLEDNGRDLREVFLRFEPLHRDLERVQGAFASRREALSDLVSNYGLLTQELGRNDESLVRLVNASNDVFEAFASEDENISLAVSRLPGTLETTENTLAKVDDLGQVLGPTLDDLRPAFRQLDVANREILPLVREGTPILRDEIRPFVRDARPFTDQIRPAANQLSAALPDLETSFGELNRFFNMFAFNPAGSGQANTADPRTGNTEPVAAGSRDEGYLFWLGWVVNNGVSLHSTSNAEGVLRRASFSVNCGTVENLITALINGNPLFAGTSPEEAAVLFEALGVDTLLAGLQASEVGAFTPGVDALIQACEGELFSDTSATNARQAQGEGAADEPLPPSAEEFLDATGVEEGAVPGEPRGGDAEGQSGGAEPTEPPADATGEDE